MKNINKFFYTKYDYDEYTDLNSFNLHYMFQHRVIY